MFSRDTACLVQTCVRQTSMMSSCHAGVPTHHPDLLLTFWTLSYMTDSHPHDIECPLCFCRIFLHVYVLIKHCVENFHCCDTQIVIIVGGTKGPEGVELRRWFVMWLLEGGFILWLTSWTLHSLVLWHDKTVLSGVVGNSVIQVASLWITTEEIIFS